MTTLIRIILGLALIVMLIAALIQTFGWLGLVAYWAVGALLILDRLSTVRQARREQELMDGSWWRDLA